MRNPTTYFSFILYLLFIFGISSCNSYKNLEKGESSISFHSAFEKDTLNVKINDSSHFKNHRIIMIPEWGISKNTSTNVEGEQFRIKGTFKTTEILDKEFGIIISRKLEFDTILKAKDGRYVDIAGHRNRVFIVQSKKQTIVE